MSAFPETPATLLVKLAAQVTGEDEANWVRFADLYVPAIRSFWCFPRSAAKTA